VRQLENLCHWLTVLAPAQWVRVEDLPPELRVAPPAMPEGSRAATMPESHGEIRGFAGAGAGEGLGEGTGESGAASPGWRRILELEVRDRLARGEDGILDTLQKDFESLVIRTALEHLRGRRVEAAGRLGLGRNTITRKIRELGLDGD